MQRLHQGRNRFLERLRYSSPVSVSFICSLPILGNGLWFLLLPGVFDSTPGYRVLALMGPAWLFGLTFVITAGAVVYTQFCLARRNARHLALIALGICYALMWSSTSFSNPRSGGVPVYFLLGLCAMWAYWLDAGRGN